MVTFSLIFLSITFGILMISIIAHIMIRRKNEEKKPPRKISLLVSGLLILHWIFFLSSGYGLLREDLADMLFLPVWLLLCIGGAVAAAYEYHHNKSFAIPIAGLTMISLLFSVFINGISSM
ncbi:hypothetical protein [Jeotgalibacillus haloalkalitolerans]|nr:hypothetical protein [Jeotgalibacillus sp. HH7-29]